MIQYILSVCSFSVIINSYSSPSSSPSQVHLFFIFPLWFKLFLILFPALVAHLVIWELLKKLLLSEILDLSYLGCDLSIVIKKKKETLII